MGVRRINKETGAMTDVICPYCDRKDIEYENMGDEDNETEFYCRDCERVFKESEIEDDEEL